MTESGSASMPIARSYGPYDAEHPPPLAFHQWAELSARVARREAEERSVILEQSGVEPPLFDAVNAFWLDALARQIGSGNMRLAEMYAAACLQEMNARKAEQGESSPREGVVLAGADLDATGLLVELPDQTALPFRAPAIGPTSEPRPATEGEEADLRGETQFLPALELDEDALPFRIPEEEDES